MANKVLDMTVSCVEIAAARRFDKGLNRRRNVGKKSASLASDAVLES